MSVIVILVLIGASTVLSESCQEPVSEGSIVSLYKYIHSIEDVFQWKVGSDSAFGDIPVTDCKVNNPTCQSFFQESYSSTIAYANGKYRVTLTIHNVTRERDAKIWKWFDGSKKLGECELKVYAFLSSPACVDAQISSTEQYVTWMCEVTHVYPNITCIFEYKDVTDKVGGRYTRVAPQHIGNSQIKSTSTSSFNSYRCTMDLKITRMMSGSLLFRFTAIMDLESLGSDKSIDKTSFSNTLRLYKPEVTSFKANSESNVLMINAGDKVTFTCDAQGVPKPLVFVTDERLGNYLTLEETPSEVYSETKSLGHKTMGCRDTGNYTCMASNSVGNRIADGLAVFVKCVPELTSPQDPGMTKISTSKGKDVSMAINIVGFPEPTDYSLIQGFHDTDDKRQKRHDLRKQMKDYVVEYLPGKPPQGVVALRIFSVGEEDSGQYEFAIYNGIGHGLEITFSVDIKNQDGETDKLGTVEITGIVVGAISSLALLASGCYFLIKMWRRRYY